MSVTVRNAAQLGAIETGIACFPDQGSVCNEIRALVVRPNAIRVESNSGRGLGTYTSR